MHSLNVEPLIVLLRMGLVYHDASVIFEIFIVTDRRRDHHWVSII